MKYHRRDFLKTALGALLTTQAGCAVHNQSSLRCPTTLDDFVLENDLGSLPVYRSKNASGPAIILLHEMPGMSLSNLSLARCLANQGFSVFLPLMFGEPAQERFIGGYFQSCAQGEFDCTSPSGGSAILNKLRETHRRIIERRRAPIGIIGMCLTGAFPLALLGDGVEAAILCQPTLPFNALLMRPIGEQKRSIGLSQTDIEHAQRSDIPLLATRFTSDPLCPDERFEALRGMFAGRIATIEINAATRGHSTLAADLQDDVLADAMSYLKVRLGVEKQARRMKLAKFNGQNCGITADGRWRAM